MFLLDTNVISELRRPERANPRVVNWASTVPAEQHFLSATTIFEIEYGALRIARKDDAQGKILRTWIDEQILVRFANRILSFDKLAALKCAKLHIPNPRAERDAMIAATALAHGMKIATRNVVDFMAMGVEVINPWGAD